MATVAQIQAALDAQGLRNLINIIKQYEDGTTTSLWYVTGGLTAPGKAGWVTSTNTDSAATQATDITTATKALYP